MPQGAYNPSAPNGSGRSLVPDRALLIFRLYVKIGVPLEAITPGRSVLSSVLDPVRGGIRAARTFIQGGLGTLQGRTLLKEFRFSLILEQINFAPEYRTHFQYTRDRFFTDTPFVNAKGITSIRIVGRTNFYPVIVNGVQVDGDAGLKDFGDTLDAYMRGGEGRLTSDYELYLIDLRTPISAEDPFGDREWLIHPRSTGLAKRQAAQRPFMQHFELDVIGLESNRDRARAESGFLGGLLSGSLFRNLLSTLRLDEVTAALDDVFGTVREVQALTQDISNAVLAISDYLTGINQIIEASIGEFRALETRIQEIIGRIEDAIAIARSIPDVAEEQWKLLIASAPGLVEGPDPGIIAADDLRRVRDVLRAAMADPGRFRKPVAGTAAPTRVVRVPLGPDATLESVAQNANVTVEQLVDTNGLRWPYVSAGVRPEHQRAIAQEALATAQAQVTAASAALAAAQQRGETAANLASLQHQLDAAAVTAATATHDLEAADAAIAAVGLTSDRVRYAGEALDAPQRPTASGPTPSIAELTPEKAALLDAPVTREDRLFGVDLALVDGSLVWDSTRRDLVLERGLEHMARVQVRYVKLPLGGLRYAPGIGNYAWEDLGSWQTPGTNSLLAYAMWQTLRQDPRVQTIKRVRATTAAGAAELIHDIVLIDGETLPGVRVPVS